MPTNYLVHPNINPIIISIGPLDLRWYGLMYLVGFLFAWWWGNRQCRQPHYAAQGWTEKNFSDLLFWAFIGVIVGGRVGYVLFYQWQYFLAHPLYLFDITSGGMSFHGGLLGVITVLWIFAWRSKRSLLAVGDFVAPLVPIGLGAGRIGNFINGELWGRVTDVPWAMIFPAAGNLPRHPSQLYQALLEGLVLFVVLALYSRTLRPVGSSGGLFLRGYGLARFVGEYAGAPEG